MLNLQPNLQIFLINQEKTDVKKVDASETTFMTEDNNRKISKIY